MGEWLVFYYFSRKLTNSKTPETFRTRTNAANKGFSGNIAHGAFITERSNPVN
jgi:hypothetical protein